MLFCPLSASNRGRGQMENQGPDIRVFAKRHSQCASRVTSSPLPGQNQSPSPNQPHPLSQPAPASHCRSTSIPPNQTKSNHGIAVPQPPRQFPPPHPNSAPQPMPSQACIRSNRPSLAFSNAVSLNRMPPPKIPPNLNKSEQSQPWTTQKTRGGGRGGPPPNHPRNPDPVHLQNFWPVLISFH